MKPEVQGPDLSRMHKGSLFSPMNQIYNVTTRKLGLPPVGNWDLIGNASTESYEE